MHIPHSIRALNVPYFRYFTRFKTGSLQLGSHPAVKKKQLPAKQLSYHRLNLFSFNAD
jgi:hypothetical protein